ncbi:MAG TPA: PDZ domain-containing protein [Nitrospiraceae bacterium]|jgi:hypothetical protein
MGFERPVEHKALPLGRAFLMLVVALVIWGGGLQDACAQPEAPAKAAPKKEMTKEDAVRLGEEFGIIVEEVDEGIRKELQLQRLEGVAVLEVIGNSMADYAGIKVKSVIKEIDKVEIRNLIDFGNALKRAMTQCNFTVGTYETADPSNPVGWGVNFHFVGCRRD